MKRILLLFIGAAASFILLAYIDEYENLILPLMESSRVESSFLEFKPPEMAPEFRGVIVEFNQILALAYLKSDPSELLKGPVDPKLIPPIAQEIEYLLREGKVMDISTREIYLVGIVLQSSFIAKVKTKELVDISYISKTEGGEVVVARPPVWHLMEYTLVWGNGSWTVASFETLSIRDKE